MNSNSAGNNSEYTRIITLIGMFNYFLTLVDKILKSRHVVRS